MSKALETLALRDAVALAMSSSLFLPNHACRGEGEAHSLPLLLPRAFSSLIPPPAPVIAYLGCRGLAYEKMKNQPLPSPSL